MPGNVALTSLSKRLLIRAQSVFELSQSTRIPGREELTRAFREFGEATGAAGITLEDALSAASSALTDVAGRIASHKTTVDISGAAGVALAAVSRGHNGAWPANHEMMELRDETFPDTQHARLEALHRINRAATSNFELSEMLDTIAHVVVNTTRSDASAIFLYDESTGLLSLQAAVGMEPGAVGNVTIRLGTGIIGRAALEGRLIAAPDAQAHESYFAHPGVGDEKYRSQVSVPMLIQGQNRLVGVLNIHSVEQRDFDQDELEFLRTVAGELAITIENARRHSNTDERLRQKIAELGTLQRVTRSLASTLSLDGVLRLIAEQAVELVHAEAAAIFRLDQTQGQGEPEAMVQSRVGTFRNHVNIEDRNAVVDDVLKTGTARRKLLSYTDGPAILFCLPLLSARDTVGALCFRLQDDNLGEDTLAMLQSFADSAAMAIENAQLYEDAMMSLKTQQTLVQEMHHRVRNNLQTVAALLSLQLRRNEHEPWAVQIREAISRIQSIAAVHDLLSDERRLAGTTVDVIARMVAEDAHSTLIPPGLQVRFDIPPTTLMVPSRQATIMSLLINELAANAISHGFENRDHGYIRIRAWEEDGMANVEVFNDGQKVPENFDPATSEGLGMRITNGLVTSDLKGTFTITSMADGTSALMRFPIANDGEAV
ncbi:MAG TPA: GAF domain-containing protein [Thermomicrobiales bacterium]|nr:GAF domain-containing protein [Thermomicrobiales bacterium]